MFQLCRDKKIDYIVAPYEADAQITYLVKQGLADFAITEDSDLLAFGCPKVRLDQAYDISQTPYHVPYGKFVCAFPTDYQMDIYCEPS